MYAQYTLPTLHCLPLYRCDMHGIAVGVILLLCVVSVRWSLVNRVGNELPTLPVKFGVRMVCRDVICPCFFVARVGGLGGGRFRRMCRLGRWGRR